MSGPVYAPMIVRVSRLIRVPCPLITKLLPRAGSRGVKRRYKGARGEYSALFTTVLYLETPPANTAALNEVEEDGEAFRPFAH